MGSYYKEAEEPHAAPELRVADPRTRYSEGVFVVNRMLWSDVGSEPDFLGGVHSDADAQGAVCNDAGLLGGVHMNGICEQDLSGCHHSNRPCEPAGCHRNNRFCELNPLTDRFI